MIKWCSLIMLMSQLAFGGQWHVYNLTQLQSYGSSTSILPGDTIWIHGGTYAGPITCSLNGTPNHPIIVRNWDNERVVIDGGNSGGAPIFNIKGSYTWYWGLEIMSSATNKVSTQSTSWPTDIAYGEGVEITQGGIDGTGCKFINLYVHDTRQGFSWWKEAANSEIYGCIISDNGWIAPDRPHGHNIYEQNTTGTKLCRDNIILRAYSHNIQSYGSSASNEDNESFVGNVGLDGGERDFMQGGDNVSFNPVWQDNFMYRGDYNAAENLFYMGYPIGYSPGTQNAIVTDNFILNGLLTFNKNVNMTFERNTIWSLGMDGDVPSMDDDTVTTSRPNWTRVYIRYNIYEPGRANIIVLNFLDEAKVNITPQMPIGSSYVIKDAQNYGSTPIVEGIYRGGSISIPMLDSYLIPPNGNDPRGAQHTTKEFGVFVLSTGTPASDTRIAQLLTDHPYMLYAYPNPFNPSTTIEFSTGTAQEISVDVYDMLGRKIDHIFTGLSNAGTPTILQWDASKFGSGTYVVRVGNHNWGKTIRVNYVR